MRSNRLLAFDPGTRFLGYAAFEGTELVDFGVKSIRQAGLSITLQHLGQIFERLISEKRPFAVVYERNAFSQIRQNYRLTRAIERLEAVARRHRVRTFAHDPRTVRKVVCGSGNVSKRDLARCVVARYPETAIHLRGRTATQDRFWQNAYDALACGLTFLAMSRTFVAPGAGEGPSALNGTRR